MIRRKHYAEAFRAQIDNEGKHAHEHHASVRKGLAVLDQLHSPIANLLTIAETRSPTETQAAHERRVFNAAEQLRKTIDRKNTEFDATIGSELNNLKTRLDAKVKLQPNEFAAEIRAQFRTLNATDRINYLNELVAANDGPSLAALIKAPKALTGLPDGMASNYVDHVYSKHAPTEWDEQKALLQLVMTRLDILRTAREAVSEYADPVRLQEIARQEEAARKAQEDFDSSTGRTA